MKISGIAVKSFGLIATLTLAGQLAMGQDIYVYPAAGQTDEQLGDDRYACHLWAVDESGFDPSKDDEVALPRTVKVPVPKNAAEGAAKKGAIAGAVAGGIIGARGKDTAEGVVIGAVLGTMVGSTIEEQGQREATKTAKDTAQNKAKENAKTRSEIALRKSSYRRAVTACLEGRGYTVR